MTDQATRYARSDGVHIAYQTHGSGPPDLVMIPGIFSHIELGWEEPTYARFLRRLASFSRLVLLDLRGVGLSDRAAVLPTLEEQMDDVTTVLDEIGSKEAIVLGVSQGGPMAMLFAATHPARTSGLILYGAYAAAVGGEGDDWTRTDDWIDRYLERVETSWGTGMHLPSVAPSMVSDPGFARWWSKFERHVCAPGNALAFVRTHSKDDVRDVLGAISAPTLVLQRAHDRFRDPRNGEYLASRIPGASLVKTPGFDHLPYVGDQESILREIEYFVTGIRRGPPPDRRLATVMFTDLVESTRKAVEMGDQRWHELLDLHHASVRRELDRFRGTEVKTAGDGFLATFDGPARAIRCAVSIRESLLALGLEMTAGLHTGEIEISDGDVAGIAVHIGARVAGMALPGDILVSRTVKDLVAGSGIRFSDRGTHSLKGAPDEWQLFAVDDSDSDV